MPVELAPLVVKAVGNLVANDGTNGSVVVRRRTLGVEKRRLQNAGEEINVVHRRIVIRIDDLRRVGPLTAINGFADLGQLARVVKGVGAQHVEHIGAAIDVELAVVAPDIGVADALLHQRQLLQRPGTRGRAHPRQRLNVGTQRVAHAVQ